MKKRGLIKGKKGFTLIELIVVLIILAVMAAFAIPSMMGFVNQARQEAMLADARTGLVAAQIVATRLQAGGKTPTETLIIDDTEFGRYTDECPGEFSGATVDANTRITKLVYTYTGVGVATYENGAWKTADIATP